MAPINQSYKITSYYILKNLQHIIELSDKSRLPKMTPCEISILLYGLEYLTDCLEPCCDCCPRYAELIDTFECNCLSYIDLENLVA